ncbi:MAG: hypothetical protein IH868_02000 [Chloroflexi bacterium]|nr:hypothetical protein [Chloroflexota bacterium]
MIRRLRRRIFLVPLLIVVIATISGGVVAAQALTGHGGEHKDRLFDRTAEILGIDPSNLKDAFEQAGGELTDEKIADLLAKLVHAEKLSEEEAAEIEAWLASRPESIGEITAATVRELIDGDGPTFRSVFRIGRPALSAAVLSGEITEEDAAEVKAWLDDFPDGLLDLGLPEAIEFFKIQVERRTNDEEPLPLTIDGLVEAGIIEQGDADAFEAWWHSRPDAANKLIPGPLHFGLPFAESFFFGAKTHAFKTLPDLFGGLGHLGERFHLEDFFGHSDHDSEDGNGSGAFEFEFDFESPDGRFPFRGFRFGDLFGDRGPLVIPELGEIDPENLDDLRQRLEERFRDFGGSGLFEFRFNDGEPFRFEFPDLDDEAPSEETDILNRSI